MVDIGIESAQSVLGEVTSHFGLGLERYTELNQIHHSAWLEEASNHVGIVRGKLGARWAMVYTSFIEMARGLCSMLIGHTGTWTQSSHIYANSQALQPITHLFIDTHTHLINHLTGRHAHFMGTPVSRTHLTHKIHDSWTHLTNDS